MEQYRATKEELLREVNLLSNDRIGASLTSELPYYTAILNKYRQIIFSTEKVWKDKGFSNFESLMGLRPGDSLCCVNAKTGFDGCGTGEPCKYCAANKAIVHAIETRKIQTETCIVTTVANSRFVRLRFKVTVAPIALDDNNFYIFTAEDITTLKDEAKL